jgi:hypothetical protein
MLINMEFAMEAWQLIMGVSSLRKQAPFALFLGQLTHKTGQSRRKTGRAGHIGPPAA